MTNTTDVFPMSVRCALSLEEKLHMGAEMADSAARIEQLEDDLKELKESYKSRTTAAEAILGRCQRALNNGWQMADVECKWFMDMPDKGQKSIVRQDTGEIVQTDRMEASDSQAVLDFTDLGIEVPADVLATQAEGVEAFAQANAVNAKIQALIEHPDGTPKTDDEIFGVVPVAPTGEATIARIVFDRECKGKEHFGHVQVLQGPQGFTTAWWVRLGSLKHLVFQEADEMKPVETCKDATFAGMQCVLISIREWLATQDKDGDDQVKSAKLMAPVAQWANEQLNSLEEKETVN